jgi:uncharacterized membrane protein YozB (DUF420 family)
MLFTSYGLKRKRKYSGHGITMLVTVLMNAGSFLLVMLPSLLGLATVTELTPLSISMVVAHACLGSATMALGLWLVGSWHLQSSIQGCTRRRKIMRLTFIAWLVTLLLGVLLYMSLYTNFLL